MPVAVYRLSCSSENKEEEENKRRRKKRGGGKQRGGGKKEEEEEKERRRKTKRRRKKRGERGKKEEEEKKEEEKKESFAGQRYSRRLNYSAVAGAATRMLPHNGMQGTMPGLNGMQHLVPPPSMGHPLGMVPAPFIPSPIHQHQIPPVAPPASIQDQMAAMAAAHVQASALAAHAAVSQGFLGQTVGGIGLGVGNAQPMNEFSDHTLAEHPLDMMEE
jgi:hypothetical protein